MSKNRNRLPWKRGPVAREIAQRADGILARLRDAGEFPRPWLSLRAAARLLGVSTQPLRDWIRRGQLVREHPRRIGKPELERFVSWLWDRAKPYEEDRRERFFPKHQSFYPAPFDTLRKTQFAWPAGRTSLKSKELAELIGCHPSLISKAIQQDYLPKRGHQAGEWHHVTRRAWDNSFFGTLTNTPRWPPCPAGDKISTYDATDHLIRCGIGVRSQRTVRRLIAKGELVGGRFKPGGHKIYVTRASLIKFRNQCKKTS